MRKLVAWLLVTLGIAALVRKLRKRQEPEWVAEPAPATEPTPTAAEPMPPAGPATPAEPTPGDTASQESPTTEAPSGQAADPADDPAAELRERLARSKADMPSSEEDSVADRRSAVHEQGRSALDEMQPADDAADEPADRER